jgi:hypothetical protein
MLSKRFPSSSVDSMAFIALNDDDVYLDKLQTRGVKKSILSQCET